MKKFVVVLLLCAVLAVRPAMGFTLTDTFGAHVLTASADNTLNAVYFEVDVKVDGCAAGQYLQLLGHSTDTPTNQTQIRSTFALLLAARLSGQTIHIIGNGDAGPTFCTIYAVELR